LCSLTGLSDFAMLGVPPVELSNNPT